MGQSLAHTYPIANEIFDQANRILDFPLSQIAWEGPVEGLDDTANTQPALLVHSVAALSVFQVILPNFQPAYTAGHSMGEISALVACGALPYPAALSLARRRGELMKEAGQLNPGGMAAILGLDIPVLEDLCAHASQAGEVVQVANDNCPGQVVVSGASPALERLVELAKAAGARRALKLAVSIAAHSPLMAHAQVGFNQAVEAASIVNPRLPLIGNVTARPLDSAAAIRADLQAQLNSRVRWTETIQWMASQGIETYIEIGNGSVLCGLVKRIQPEATCLTLGTPEDFQKLSVD
jgi:[acyl-carrier-protein] S-malonyltransferase